MASKKRGKNNEDLDDFGLDDEFDFGGGGDDDDDDMGMSMKDDRKAVTIVASNFAKGAKDYLMDPKRQKQFIKNSLPSGYSAGFDVVDTGASFAKELYDTAKTELKPLSDAAKGILDKTLPKDGQYKSGGLVEKLAKWSRRKESGPMSEDEMNENAITTGLSEIFQLQAEQQEQREEGAAEERNADRALQMKLHGGSLGYLKQIATATSKQAAYQDQILIKFQQKQLELSYRQYFTQRQLLTAFKEHAESSKDNMSVIAKNTGLPDFVKMHNKEVAEQVLKTTSIAALTGGARDWFSNGTKKLLKHYKTEMREFVGGLGMMMDGVNGALENQQMMAEQGQDKRSFMAEQVGSGLGQYGANWVSGKLSGKLLEMAKKNPKVIQMGKRISNFAENVPQKLLDWVRDNEDDGEGGIWRAFLNSTKRGLGDHTESKAVRVSVTDKMDEAVHFNLQTRQTLVEVIPGWLARIHHELRVTRTGDESLSPMRYSFEKATFEETKTSKDRLNKKYFGSSNRDSVKGSAMQLAEIAKVFEGSDLTPEELKVVVAHIADRASGKDVSLSEDSLLAKGKFGDLGRGETEQIQRKIQNHLGVSYQQEENWRGKMVTKRKFDSTSGGYDKLKQLQDVHKSLYDGRPEFVKMIQKEIAEGNQDLLLERGLVVENDSGGWDANTDYFDKAVLAMYDELPPNAKMKDPSKKLMVRSVIKQFQQSTDGNKSWKLVPKFATGGKIGKKRGLINGPGTGTSDSVPIHASTDEFVVRAQSTRQRGALDFLEDFNRHGMGALRKWGSRLKNSVMGQSADVDFNGPMPQGLADRYLSRLRGFGSSVKDAMRDPDDDGFMGPMPQKASLTDQLIASKGIKRNITDVYELIDQWAPFWAFGGMMKGGIDTLGRLGGAAKNMLKRFDPRKLKRLGKLLNVQAIKEKASGAWAKTQEIYGNVNDFIGKHTGGLGGKLKGVKDKLLGKFTDFSAKYKDIYVKGEEEPRLFADKMIEGAYLDRLSGKIIKQIKDITGPVDDAQTGKVIVSIKDAKKGFVDKYGKSIPLRLKDMVMGKIKGLLTGKGKIAGFLKKITGGISGFTSRFKDIYVKGESEPKMTADKMQDGAYKDHATGKIIKRIQDITGPVALVEDDSIVITKADIKKGLVDKFGKALPLKLFGMLKNSFTSGFARAGRIGRMFKRGLTAVKRALNAYEDVYVKGETEPRLLAVKLQEGLYYDKETEKPIYSVADIKGPVIDENAAVVLNKRDLKKGLVNQYGKPITTLSQKVKGLLTGAVKVAGKVAKGALGLVGGALKLAGRGLMGIKNMAVKGWKALTGGELDFQIGMMVNRPVVDKLEQIRIILDTRMKKPKGNAFNDADGDGSRDGSAAEQQEADAAAGEKSWKEKLMEKFGNMKQGAIDKAKSFGGGVMDMFGSIKSLFGGMGSMMGAFTKFLPAATTVMSLVGKLKLGNLVATAARAAPMVMAGAGTALGWAGAAIGGTLSVLGTVASGIVSIGATVISSPVLLTAAAAALVGYAAYKLYKYATRTDDYLLKFRMMQYGVDPEEEEYVSQILSVEKLYLEGVKVGKGKLATLGGNVKFKLLMEIFGVKETQPGEENEQMERLLGWLKNRFKPVFLSVVTILFDITGKKDLLTVDDKLTCDQSLDLVKRSHFAEDMKNSPYDFDQVPFADEEDAEYDAGDVQDEYEDILEDIEDDRKRRDSNATANKTMTPEQQKSIDDKKAAGDKAAADKKAIEDKKPGLLDKAGDMVSKGWDKTKELANKGWEATKDMGKGIMSGLGSAWDATKNMAAGAVNGVAGMLPGQTHVDPAELESGKPMKIDPKIMLAAVLRQAAANGITDPEELAAFLGVMHVETGGWGTISEDLRYKKGSADRIMGFNSYAAKAGKPAVEAAIEQGPKALANIMYSNMRGNNGGNDGWNYRGRGPMQLTLRGNYEAMKKRTGIDVVNNPDLLLQPDVGALSAVDFWNKRVGHELGGSGNMTKITRIVNGKDLGLEERKQKRLYYKDIIASGQLGKLVAGQSTQAADAKNSLTAQAAMSGSLPPGTDAGKKSTPATPPPGAPKTATGGAVPPLLARPDAKGSTTPPKDVVKAAPAAAVKAPPTSTVKPLTTPPVASTTKQDTTVAAQKATVAAVTTAVAKSSAATTTAKTSTDQYIAKGIDSLVKVNMDQLAVLQSINSKLDVFGGKATAASGKSSPAPSPTQRQNNSPPVAMGKL